MTASKNSDAPAPQSEPGLLEQVAAALSEYGNPMSASAPYKQILGVSLAGTTFNSVGDTMTARIEIRSDHQSPYGDNKQYVTPFELTEAQVGELGLSGPHGFRARFNQMAQKIFALKEAAIEAEKRQMREALASPAATALKVALTAPRRARFTKRAGAPE